MSKLPLDTPHIIILLCTARRTKSANITDIRIHFSETLIAILLAESLLNPLDAACRYNLYHNITESEVPNLQVAA